MSFGHAKSILKQLNIKVKNNLQNILFSKDGNFIYSFSDTTYIKYKFTKFEEGVEIKLDKGPVSIAKNWKGIPDKFDSCGYVNYNNSDKLIFTKGNQYWIFNENNNRTFTGFPQNLNRFELFRNKSQLNNISGIDAIFQWQDTGSKSYNCFVSGPKIYMININNPAEITEKHFSYVFPDMPAFIKSATQVPFFSFIIFFADYTWFLYDESKRQLIGHDSIIDDSTSSATKTSSQMEKVQEWCRQLYSKKIYSQQEYNECIRDSRMVGTSMDQIEEIDKKETNDSDLQYKYGLYNKALVGNNVKTVFREHEPVYLVSQSGFYLKSDEDGLISTVKTLKEPVKDYEWFLQKTKKNEYGIKDAYNRYLQGDTNTISAPNNYIGPLSKWNIIQIGTSFNIFHHDTKKSLKTDPLSLDYYNPIESMTWNIVELEGKTTMESYDAKDVIEKTNYVIDMYKKAYRNKIIMLEAKNFENSYQKEVENCFEILKKYLDSYISKTARTYYIPGPPDNELIKKDPSYREYHNKKYSWTHKVSSNAGRIPKLVPYMPDRNSENFENIENFINFGKIFQQLQQTREREERERRIRDRREQLPPLTGTYRDWRWNVVHISGTDKYNQALSKVERHLNTIKSDIDKRKLNYANDRNKVRKSIEQKYKETDKQLESSVQQVDSWKNELTKKLKKATEEREKYKRQVQYQLSGINKMKHKETSLTNQVYEYDKINTDNIVVLEQQNKGIKSRIYMYYSLMAIIVVWMLFIIYMMTI